ncbi:MAG: EF-hand domain-containing protein [Desulfobulbus sp.]|nr:EF-hand domain-containing protein [Desulfobulbus sp.]
MSVTATGSSVNGYSIGQMMSRMQPRGPSGGATSSGTKGKTDLSQLVTQLDANSSRSLETTDEIQSLADAINRASGVSSDLNEFLSTYDTDQSGALSEEEAISALEANPPQGPPPSAGMASSFEEELVSSLDTNGDGVISAEEAQGIVDVINNATGSSLEADDFVSDYDSNGDDSFSLDEAVTAMEANRPQGASSVEDKGVTAAALETYLAMSAMGSQNSGDLLTMMMGNSQESINSMV